MTEYLKMPLVFLSFWFFEAPKNIVLYMLSLNHSFLRFFSAPSLLRTFFRPIKNEYRQGLVGFSIAMGIFVKSILLIFTLALFVPLVVLEICVLLVFVTLPLTTMMVFLL